MGEHASPKVGNMISMIERGIIAPIEMICRRTEVDPHTANV